MMTGDWVLIAIIVAVATWTVVDKVADAYVKTHTPPACVDGGVKP